MVSLVCKSLKVLLNSICLFSLWWHPTPVLLPGKSQGRRSLVGCSPWGHKESDTTERLHFNFSLSCIGEGNGNPLQCSCLENPRDGGAWWAAIYGVTQSWTRLKWLSSSRFHLFIFTFISIPWETDIRKCFYILCQRIKHGFEPMFICLQSLSLNDPCCPLS